MANSNLTKARNAKNDEFYTQLSDIEKELKYYKNHFKDKVVYCNCDDPRVSNFFHFFSYNFERLGLKKLIATCYKNQNIDLFSKHESEQAVFLEYNGDKNGNNIPDIHEIGVNKLKGDGDFRSQECIELLKQADIIVTNPPFSLFREYISQLIQYEKKFIIIGSQNAISYKEVFKLIQDNKIWLGYNSVKKFAIPLNNEHNSVKIENGVKYAVFGNVCWFTNLDIAKRHEDLILYKKYSPEEYPMYDNYNAIEVSKVTEIPIDYNGAMGVPITFLDKYNPQQFEILGITDRENNSGLKTKTYTSDTVPNAGDLNRRAAIKIGNNYKATYARLLIRNKML
jgi:hypothetical protein